MSKTLARMRRKVRIRKKLAGSAERPRLVVYRSNRHIYAQLVDDLTGQTLVSSSSLTLGKTGEALKADKEAAAMVLIQQFNVPFYFGGTSLLIVVGVAMLIRNGQRLINSRNWTELVKPEKLVRDTEPSDTFGRFVCEPLERGFGTTLGNALRRVLLSSLQGAAIVAARIEGVQHEFSTIPGVIEDVTEVILNLKQVRLAMKSSDCVP